MTNLAAWLLLGLLPAAALKPPPIPMPGPAESDEPPPLEQRLPSSQRARYEIFTQKCGRCHAPEKALQAGFPADAWDAYLGKKVRRVGGVSERQRDEIAAFLRYWAIAKR